MKIQSAECYQFWKHTVSGITSLLSECHQMRWGPACNVFEPWIL